MLKRDGDKVGAAMEARGPRIDPVTRAGQRSNVVGFVGGRMHSARPTALVNM